jgi:RNA polymerase sigma factor (sigma-70 family)
LGEGGGGVALTEYEHVFPELYRFAYQAAYRILGERSASEDIAQETLARAYARWSRVSRYAEPWVTRVASNQALDVVRRHHRSPWPEVADADPAVAERMDLQRALLDLPRRQRDVVMLRYGADLPEAEVAAFLMVSVGTVKTHAHRGLAALRLGLATPDEEEVHARPVR